MKIILISGKAQSGKDTVANLICEKLLKDEYEVLITHYADLLKFICRNYFNWDGNKDDKGRSLLQHVGTDIVRKNNPDLWVNFVAKMLELFHDKWDYVIIPDCRFPNEIDNMKKCGFNTAYVRIIRKNFNSPLSIEQQHHESETALDQYIPDYCIINDGTVADLKLTVQKWIEEALYEKKNGIL